MAVLSAEKPMPALNVAKHAKRASRVIVRFGGFGERHFSDAQLLLPLETDSDDCRLSFSIVNIFFSGETIF
jgi:hypothetical protein